MNSGDWILAFTAGILAITAFLIYLSIRVSSKNVKVSSKNIELQHKYIRAVTRPWVYFKLENDVLCDNVNKEVTINSKFHNVGASPALECKIFMQFTSKEEYPKVPPPSDLRNVTKWIMVFPKEEIGIVTVTLPVSLENEDNDAVQNAITRRTPYLHTYLTYKSEDGENYYLKQRFKIEYYSIKDGNIQVIWSYISGDTKPLK